MGTSIKTADLRNIVRPPSVVPENKEADMQKIKVGNDVEWKWGRSNAEGTVAEKFTADVSRKIRGKTVKRKADSDEPAFLIKQEDGDRVLKSQSELKKTDG
jgi:hypothetical protein